MILSPVKTALAPDDCLSAVVADSALNDSTLVRPQFLFSPTSFTRAQVNTRPTRLTANGTLWEEISTADVPRFHGTAQRLRIEGQRTNSIRNPRAEGIVPGSPGTLPINWTISAPAGLTRTLTAETRNGISGVRVRLAGTASSTGSIGLTFDGNTVVAAAQNQDWWASVFWQGVRATGLTGEILLEVWALDAGGGFLSTGSAPASGRYTASATDFVRLSSGRVLPDATTAFARANIRTASIASGTAIDIEWWMGWPQQERGSFASTPILPPSGAPAASTRTGDLAAATLASLGIPTSGTCSILMRAVIPQQSSAPQIIMQIDDGTNNNRWMIRNEVNNTNIVLYRANGGALATSAAATVTHAVVFNLGVSIDGMGRAAMSFNGGSAIAMTGGVTSGLTTVSVGSGLNNQHIFGEVECLTIIPGAAFSDAALAIATANYA